MTSLNCRAVMHLSRKGRLYAEYGLILLVIICGVTAVNLATGGKDVNAHPVSMDEILRIASSQCH